MLTVELSAASEGPMVPDQSIRTPDPLPASLFERLEYVVLEHVAGTHRILGHPSPWLFRSIRRLKPLQLSVDSRTQCCIIFWLTRQMWQTGDATSAGPASGPNRPPSTSPGTLKRLASAKEPAVCWSYSTALGL